MGRAGEKSESLRRKRQDAWGINWGARKIHLMEYTRPNDRAASALQTTDTQKIARYRPLSEKLTELLPGWEVKIQSYAMGIRGSYTPEVWTTNLATFGIKRK